MSNVENLEDHMAFSCKCGSVHFNLLKSSFIECSGCGLKLEQFWGSKQNKIEQQPIAWRWGVPKLKNGDFEWRYSLNQTRPDAIPLYTTPPQCKPPQFPTMLRKMWSGSEVQDWINENWNRGEA